jgi:hypothetical protein
MSMGEKTLYEKSINELFQRGTVYDRIKAINHLINSLEADHISIVDGENKDCALSQIVLDRMRDDVAYTEYRNIPETLEDELKRFFGVA